MQIATHYINDLYEDEIEDLLNEMYKGVEFFKKTKPGFTYELTYDHLSKTIVLKTLSFDNGELN